MKPRCFFDPIRTVVMRHEASNVLGIFIEGIKNGKKELLKGKNVNQVNIICDTVGKYRRKNLLTA